LPDLGDRIFWDEISAREFIERTRWPDGPCCTRCGSARVIRMGGRTQAGMLFCRDCRNKFTCRIGTFMEHSHVPLHKWLQAVLLVANGERLSPQRLVRRLDLGSYRTAWLMAQRIREALYRRGVEKRARPSTMHVAPMGAARNGACNPREVTFDDAVQALIACPQTYATRSNGQHHAGDRNGDFDKISSSGNPPDAEVPFANRGDAASPQAIPTSEAFYPRPKACSRIEL
jgi:transposase-like protein